MTRSAPAKSRRLKLASGVFLAITAASAGLALLTDGFLFLGERLAAFEIGGMALIGLGLFTIDGRLFGRS